MLRACQTVVDGNDELIENTFAENPDMLLSDIAKFIAPEKTAFAKVSRRMTPLSRPLKTTANRNPEATTTTMRTKTLIFSTKQFAPREANACG